jgi:hypothetical protein
MQWGENPFGFGNPFQAGYATYMRAVNPNWAKTAIAIRTACRTAALHLDSSRGCSERSAYRPRARTAVHKASRAIRALQAAWAQVAATVPVVLAALVAAMVPVVAVVPAAAASLERHTTPSLALTPATGPARTGTNGRKRKAPAGHHTPCGA